MFYRFRKIDLDDPPFENMELEKVYENEPAALVHTGETSSLWLHMFLKWALDAGAVAAHFLVDRKENCLRQLIYWRPPGQDAFEWFEALPMVSSFTRDGVRDLCKWAGLSRWQARGVLRVRYHGAVIKSVCIRHTPEDYAVYFTDQRPELRELPWQPRCPCA